MELLRAFRDGYLLPFLWGKKFVEAYYDYSPPAANFIQKSDVLRAVVRLFLWPLVGLSWLLVKGSLAVKLASLVVMFSIPFLYVFQRNRRQAIRVRRSK